MEPSERTGRRTRGRLPGLGPTRDGYHLLRLLSFGGWSVVVLPRFAGEGVRVYATLGDRELVREGPSVAALAVDLYEEAQAA